MSMINPLEQTMLSENKLQTICLTILDLAKKQGATSAEVYVTANKGFSVSAHGGEVETVEYNQDKAIEITVYFGKRSGSASISDIRIEAMRAAVEAACHIAKFTDEDPASGLADENELAFHYPKLQLAFPWQITVEDAIQLAIACEREALAQDRRIMRAEEVNVGTIYVGSAYATSNGFLGYYPHTRHEISCVLVAKKGDEMQRDYSYTVAMDPARLASTSTIAKEAAERTVNRLGAKRIPTKKTPVIFAAEEARGLLGHFIGAIAGGAIYRQSSYLVDHIGKQVFSPHIKLQEHPHLEHGLGSAPFDDDGVATRENTFVEDGVLKHYALGVYSARQLGLHTTGNGGGIHNLSINTGDKSLSALMQAMDTGLLITELMGQGVNILTGDYSRGAGGYWIENGKVQYPVQEITIAGKLPEMYQHIVEVGNDVDKRGNIHTGSILIEEMMVAGD